jgi:hypothetical protein
VPDTRVHFRSRRRKCLRSLSKRAGYQEGKVILMARRPVRGVYRAVGGQLPLVQQLELIAAQFLAAHRFGRGGRNTRQTLHGTDIAADRVRSLVAPPEIIQHALTKWGHKNLLPVSACENPHSYRSGLVEQGLSAPSQRTAGPVYAAYWNSGGVPACT